MVAVCALEMPIVLVHQVTNKCELDGSKFLYPFLISEEFYPFHEQGSPLVPLVIFNLYSVR
jgi:hypothetical protein